MSTAAPDPDVLLSIVAAQTEIAAGELDLAAVIDVVCRAARRLTGGDRALVELAEDEPMVPCAAPMEVVAPADASMLSVPLVHRSAPVGVLHVMSGRAGAFDERDELALRLLSGLIAAQLHHAQAFAHARHASREDSLTGLGNRRAYEECLASEAERAIRHGRALTLALVDVNQLADINALHGHSAGDDVLVRVAHALCNVRVCDRAYRIAGDRFALLLPETTEGQAETVMRRVQHALERSDGSRIGAPVSIGLKQARNRDPAILQASTEDALMRAKRVRASYRRAA